MKKHINCTIDVEDYSYIKERDLSPSRLLRVKILDLKRGNSDEETSVMELSGKILKLTRLLGSYSAFVDHFDYTTQYNEYCENGKVKK